MSTERDELGGILMEEANANGLYMGIITTDNMADAILAAGYRKPRQVTTVEELDALPAGSVVLSDAYRHSIEDWPVSFQRWGDGDWHRGARSGSTHPDNFLPATVLHVGGAE